MRGRGANPRGPNSPRHQNRVGFGSHHNSARHEGNRRRRGLPDWIDTEQRPLSASLFQQYNPFHIHELTSTRSPPVSFEEPY